MMDRVIAFLKANPAFFIATADAAGVPHVRPFGAVTAYEGKLYICTNNQKAVFMQMMEQPRIEISCADDKGNWMRLSATTVRDERVAPKAKMLEEYPVLAGGYRADSGPFEVLYLKDARAEFFMSGKEPEIIRF